MVPDLSAAAGRPGLKADDVEMPPWEYLVTFGAVRILDPRGVRSGGLHHERDPSALEPAAIAGDWRLETMDLGPAGVAMLPEDVEFSLTLVPDGTLSGSGSCSVYEGMYAIVGGQRITISDLSAAEASDCADELADLQRLYLAILPVIDGLRLEDGALILTAAAISSELVFEPAA